MRAVSFQDLRGGRCAGAGEVRAPPTDGWRSWYVRPGAVPYQDLPRCPPPRPATSAWGPRCGQVGRRPPDLPIDHEVDGDKTGITCRQPHDRRGRGGRGGRALAGATWRDATCAGATRVGAMRTGRERACAAGTVRRAEWGSGPLGGGVRGCVACPVPGGRGHPGGGIGDGVGALYLVNDRRSALPAPRERGRRRPGMIPGRRSLDMSPARPVRPARHPRRPWAARADAGSPEDFLSA